MPIVARFVGLRPPEFRVALSCATAVARPRKPPKAIRSADRYTYPPSRGCWPRSWALSATSPVGKALVMRCWT